MVAVVAVYGSGTFTATRTLATVAVLVDSSRAREITGFVSRPCSTMVNVSSSVSLVSVADRRALNVAKLSPDSGVPRFHTQLAGALTHTVAAAPLASVAAPVDGPLRPTSCTCAPEIAAPVGSVALTVLVTCVGLLADWIAKQMIPDAPR